MSINLAIRFSHPDAVSQRVRYQRIDNILNPVWVNVQPNPIVSPSTIATDIPAGQYAIGVTPVYADGRTCTETVEYTDACPGLISITGSIQAGAMKVEYLAPSSVPKVRITILYPNGGSFTANYVNDGNPVIISLPSGLTGDFKVSGQSVCDEGSAFYSAPSAQVTVNNVANNLTITSDSIGIVITNLTGISGFTLAANINPGANISALHGAFFGPITFTWTGTPTFFANATLQLNGTVVQCKDIVGAGGSASFNAISIGATDVLRIDFNTGSCPT